MLAILIHPYLLDMITDPCFNFKGSFAKQRWNKGMDE